MGTDGTPGIMRGGGEIMPVIRPGIIGVGDVTLPIGVKPNAADVVDWEVV